MTPFYCLFLDCFVLCTPKHMLVDLRKEAGKDQEGGRGKGSGQEPWEEIKRQGREEKDKREEGKRGKGRGGEGRASSCPWTNLIPRVPCPVPEEQLSHAELTFLTQQPQLGPSPEHELRSSQAQISGA